MKKLLCVAVCSVLIVGMLTGPALADRQSEFGLTDPFFQFAVMTAPTVSAILDGVEDSVPGGTPGEVTDLLESLGLVPMIEVADPLAGATAARCTLASHYPHHSSTQPGYIHAKGDARCTVFMPSLYESGILWKKRWYGWQDTGYRNASGSGYTNQVTNVHHCAGTT